MVMAIAPAQRNIQGGRYVIVEIGEGGTFDEARRLAERCENFRIVVQGRHSREIVRKQLAGIFGYLVGVVSADLPLQRPVTFGGQTHLLGDGVKSVGIRIGYAVLGTEKQGRVWAVGGRRVI